MKKLVTLLLAALMVLASGSVVLGTTYDEEVKLPDPTPKWQIIEVYHWVVRGDSLSSIAERWGTTEEEIKKNNSEYFNDLEKRNATYGVEIKLEPGIRLFIYYLARVSKYVVRGETLEYLANGGLAAPCGFVLRTTPEEIIRQNPSWFNQLSLINATQHTNFSLVESYAIIDAWYQDPYTRDAFINVDPDNPKYGFNAADQKYGSKLVVTVPVRIDESAGGFPYERAMIQYLENNTEVIPWTVPGDGDDFEISRLQWSSFNPPPTNDELVGHPLGATFAPLPTGKDKTPPASCRILEYGNPNVKGR